jgi:hypothetical protein
MLLSLNLCDETKNTTFLSRLKRVYIFRVFSQTDPKYKDDFTGFIHLFSFFRVNKEAGMEANPERPLTVCFVDI